MAVNDIINISMDGISSYQPAAGVEIYILKTFRANTWGRYVGFQNGVTTSSNYQASTAAVANRSADWNRFAITNAEYYYVNGTDAGSGFSGIQTK